MNDPQMNTSDPIRLWPAQAEEPLGETVDDNGIVHGVTVPRLTPFLAEHGDGTALLICPGGGYGILDYVSHVVRVARRFNPLGISVFGLHYRISPPSTRVPGDALDDLRRAIRILTDRAAEFRIDPAKLVGVGFSAGANLLLVHASEPDAAPDAANLRRMILLCLWPHGRAAASYPISLDAPAALLCATHEDTVAPVAFSQEIATAMQRAGRSAEVIAYPHGGHLAFNFREDGPEVDWTADALAWMARTT